MRRWLGFIFTLVYLQVAAQVPQRPSPERLYNNLSLQFPNFLSSDEARRFEQKLRDFSNETSNQICVVVVDTLYGTTASNLATQIINEWGVGQKGKNNGVVILVKPTGAAGHRDLAIAVGYGLEGAIPDLATKRIREEEMNPYLKDHNYYAALDKGTDRLMALAKGEINVKDYTRRSKGKDLFTKNRIIPIIVIIIIIVLASRRGGGGGGYTYTGRGRNMWGGGWGGGSWGGGGWGSGDSGGSDWGGFGGGESGGGGSSGEW